MDYRDLVNGIFELGSGLLSILNIRRLVKDKVVHGISMIPISFFALWGAWNLFYYPSLNQPLSFFGGIVIFLVNAIWIFLVFYYKANEKRNRLNS
jgi:ABC-type transport system involved in cytochrome c biogenesis permease subunit